MWFILSLKNLFRNIRRTIAVIFTVALGAGALFSFDGFINGVLNEYRESTIHSHYGFGQIYTQGYREKVFEDPTKHWIANGAELEQALYEMPEIAQVFPRVSFSALIKHGNKTVSGFGQGILAEREAEFFHSLNVEEGSSLTDESNGILLGIGLARALGVEPGDTVTVMATSLKGYMNKSKFVVTGIFHTGSVDFDRRMFRIQLFEAQKLVKTDKIELVALSLHYLSDWKTVADKVQTLFPDLEATSFDVLDKVYYQHSVDWLKAQFKVIQVIILSIVLLGIFNSISTTIFERTQEIGNMRANGESIFQVLRLILTEGALLAFFGSFVGAAGAYAVLMLFINHGLEMPPGPGMTKQFLVTFHFEWHMVFYTMALSIAASVIASLFAGLKVAKMTIAKALRS